MAEFLTTYGTSSRIEEIMINAKSEIFLVSPFLQLSKTFFERLKDASDSNIVINIIYGKDELKPNERNSLADIKNLNLYYFENLHAKCYFNESKMVITSMNMYEFSEKNNREMGVLIDLIKDKDLFESAKKETMSIIKSSELIQLNKSERSVSKKEEYKKYIEEPKKDYKQGYRGYCIRCTKRVPLDPYRPLCDDCYTTWAYYKNFDFRENNCHICGEYYGTSMGSPLCNKCNKTYKKPVM